MSDFVDREEAGRQNSTFNLTIFCFISWNQGGSCDLKHKNILFVLQIIDFYNVVVLSDVDSPRNCDSCSSRLRLEISTRIDAAVDTFAVVEICWLICKIVGPSVDRGREESLHAII